MDDKDRKDPSFGEGLDQIGKGVDSLIGSVERTILGAARQAQEAVQRTTDSLRDWAKDDEFEPADPADDPIGDLRRAATEAAQDTIDAAKGFAKDTAAGYQRFVDGTRETVGRNVARGAAAVDEGLGDAPWRMAGFDDRRTRIARAMMKDVVPGVLGDRAASVVDGASIKGGLVGAGLILRLPLKAAAAPVLLGMAALETYRTVRDVQGKLGEVTRKVDAEIEAERAASA